ncbi:MAG: DUF1214 domain-containing protein [Proteobacteria bacterium]|nr:DUF1214 domain-containing protein [Pseudomonadota bacterium]
MCPAAAVAEESAKTAADAPKLTPVTIDSYVRAETDRHFKQRVEQGALGRFHVERGPIPVDRQPVVRMNRDTPYSTAIFDLTNPVTIEMPDTRGRYQTLVIINEDHYIQHVSYAPGKYTFTREKMGTRYIQASIRTLVNPEDPADVLAMTKAQDEVRVYQSDPGKFEIPNWDYASLAKLTKAIVQMGPWLPDSRRIFGSRADTDPVRHLIGTAGGIFGIGERDALYFTRFPKNNDGAMAYSLTVRDVPVDAFWSITVYNKDGFYEAPENAISLNSYTARKSQDGSYIIHFGGDPKAPNYLRIMPGWNYVVRLYRPRAEILDGTWKFPEAVPAG